MYLSFFNLRTEPFQITPDPSFLYLSKGHKEALASIIYGVEKRKGFILIMGAVGVGKTTILRSYLEKAEMNKLSIIYLFNANISYYNLLRYLLKELGIVAESDEICEMVNQLNQCLVDEYSQGRNVLLLIDEAQNMPVDTLENLRMLSNLETATEKLLQVVFSAQPEFEKTLNLEELKQLKQRIAVKAVISPLTNVEGLMYIQHRLKRAADIKTEIFTHLALREIVRVAKGIPRVINVLCDNCLVTAFGYGKKKVGVSVVKEITKDFGIPYPFYIRQFLPFLLGPLLVAGIYMSSKQIIAAPAEKASAAQQSIKVPPRGPSSSVFDNGKADTMSEEASIDRVVEKGDTLAKLVKDVYGYVDAKMIRLVRKANPNIDDEDLIVEGGRIVFPIKKER